MDATCRGVLRSDSFQREYLPLSCDSAELAETVRPVRRTVPSKTGEVVTSTSPYSLRIIGRFRQHLRA